MTSNHWDLRQLGPPPPDIAQNPHRYSSPAETARLVADCDEDDRRETEKCAAFELRQHGVAWADADDTPGPFADRAYLCGLLHGIAVAVMVLGVLFVACVGEPALRTVMAGK